MGAEIFNLDWCKLLLQFFAAFGGAMFVIGFFVSIFDFGTANASLQQKGDLTDLIKNGVKGLIASFLFVNIPVELYRFCISLQNSVSKGILTLAGKESTLKIGEYAQQTLTGWAAGVNVSSIFFLLLLIAFAYCIIKVFFEKVIRDQGFEVQRMQKDMVKRMLGVYFGTLHWAEHVADFDGMEYLSDISAADTQKPKNWMGRRTADCVGLIKGYAWLDPATTNFTIGANGMPDVSADGMYAAAAVKGTMDTMPDVPGIAVWQSGHIGVYVGNGTVVEAKGTMYGVVKSELSKGSWQGWCYLPAIQYTE